MAWALDHLDLQNGDITVQVYGVDDVAAIAAALQNDPDGWNTLHWGWTSAEAIASSLRALVARHAEGLCLPLVYRINGEIAGITRLFRIEAATKSLEIGGTVVAREWRRTPVNTNVKFLLLRHAFETLGAERVEFRVDFENHASRLAVLRLGARFEGRMRNRQIWPSGEVRDGLLFSVVRPDWPAVKGRLEGHLTRKAAPDGFETERLKLRPYRLSDAADLLAIVARNREEIVEDFPQSGNLTQLVEARAYIADKAQLAAEKQAFFFGVWHADQLIGQMQLKSLDWNAKSVEIGYFIDREHRRRGFAREILKAMAHEWLESRRFARMYARVRPENSASAALVESLGFVHEGTLRRAFRTGSGRFSDISVYARLSKS